MAEPAKQVSVIPLESRQPPPRSRTLPALLITALVAAATAGVVWAYVLSMDTPAQRVSEHPPRFEDPYSNPPTDRGTAQGRLQQLAEALLAYREGPMGGGVRWPATLDELKYAGLLPEDFRFDGELSGLPLVYQPDMPLRHDPERWVMVQDAEVGWVRSRNQYRPSRGMVCAAVILGDGTVKLLEGDELQLYGGLHIPVEEAR